jgi:hypothetical protein
LANVTIVLFNADGTEVARTKTDVYGNYRFDDVPPGNYYVQERQPDGYYDFSKNEGGLDNDGNNPLLNTITVVVDNNEIDSENDFIESIYTNCNCAPKPVIPCSICSHDSYHAHAYNIQAQSAELHWVDSYYEIAYDIYLNGTFIATVSEDTIRYTLTNLMANTNYTAAIIANNGYGGKTAQTIIFKTPDGYGWLPAITHILLD